MEPSDDMVTSAADIMAKCIEHCQRRGWEKPLYARVDLMRDDQGTWLVSELEMVEPELWFRFVPAADVLAKAVLKRLSNQEVSSAGRPEGHSVCIQPKEQPRSQLLFGPTVLVESKLSWLAKRTSIHGTTRSWPAIKGGVIGHFDRDNVRSLANTSGKERGKSRASMSDNVVRSLTNSASRKDKAV